MLTSKPSALRTATLPLRALPREGRNVVEKIKDIKDEMLMQIEQDMHEGGAERIDPKMIDGIKDLAEAEKACWEAEYYRSVTEAMEEGSMGYDDGMGYARGGRGGSGYSRGGQGGSGYNQGGRGYRRASGYEQGGYGYEQGRRGYRRGYRGQPRDSQGQYTSRRGYRRMEGGYGHDDMLMEVRQMMETADPQEREQLKMQLRQMTEQM